MPRVKAVLGPLIVLGLIALAVVAWRHYGHEFEISGATFNVGYGTDPRANWDDKPFSIGKPQQYAEDGVYLDYARSHGVYVVTHAGMIVALSAENPATGRRTHYEPMGNQFTDPANGSRFTSNGVITGVDRTTRALIDDPESVKAALDAGKPIRRSLERCYIRPDRLRTDPDAQLIVDPRHRFLFELNEWSRAQSGYLLEQPEEE